MALDWLGDFEAVVFDMDGVLVDSEPLHLEALNRVLADEGHALDARANLEFVGASLEYTWTTLVERLGLDGRLEDYYQRYDQAVLAVLRAGPLEPRPGALALLAALRAEGARVGLATQSRRSWTEATLAGLGLRDAFDVVVTGEMVACGKPAPDIYLRACALLGARPERSLAIEDSVPGIQAARAAGMVVVGVLTDYASSRLKPEVEVLVERLDALLAPDARWPRWRPAGTLRTAAEPGQGACGRE